MEEKIIIHCSELERCDLCPGSWDAGRKVKSESGALAERGTRIHAGLEKCITMRGLADKVAFEVDVENICSDMKDDEARIVRWFAWRVFQVVEEDGGAYAIESEFSDFMEIGDVTVSGTLDLRVRTKNKIAHVFDYKSGMADTSDENVQAQAYALMTSVRVKEDCNGVRVHILAACNESGETHTHSLYTKDMMPAIRKRIDGICKKVVAANQRIPGEVQCKWCDARGTEFCPESRAIVKHVGSEFGVPDVTAVFGSMTPEQRGRAVDACKAAILIAERVVECAKKMLQEDPDAIVGYAIGKPSQRSSISDAGKAFEILRDKLGVSPEEFLPCVKTSKKAITDMLVERDRKQAEQAGEKPEKKVVVERLVGTILAPCIEVTEVAGAMRKVKS